MYIHASRGALLALVFSMATALLIPFIPDEFRFANIEIVLTASTFLFAIIAGFYLSRLNSRYDIMRDTIAREDALWLTLFQQSRAYPDPFRSKIADVIDRYYIFSLDYPLGMSYKATTKLFLSVYQLLRATDTPVTEPSGILLDDTYSLLKELEETRNKSSVIQNERLEVGQWIILIVLAALISICLFLLAAESVFLTFTFIVLFPIFVLFLLVMRDLQNFRLGGTVLLGESGQEVLESIGKPRYYNEEQVRDGAMPIPADVTSYRVGRHEPGSDADAHDIEVVTHTS